MTVEAVGVEAEADWEHLRTPETYLGYDRGSHFSSPGEVELEVPRTYTLPERLAVNGWALSGEWTIRGGCVVSERARSSIVLRFHARDAHLVLSPGTRRPIPFRVLLDGQVPGPAHGVDVDDEGNGQLQEGRMYQLVRQDGTVRERTLEIEFLDAGAEAYAFTFG